MLELSVSDMQKFRVANLSDNPTITQQKRQATQSRPVQIYVPTPKVCSICKGYRRVVEEASGKAVKSAIGPVVLEQQQQ